MTDNGKNNVGIGSEYIQLEGLENDNIQNVMKKIDEDPNNIFIQTGKSSDGSYKTVFLVKNEKDKQSKGQVICEDLNNINKIKYPNLELFDNPTSECDQTVKLLEQNEPKKQDSKLLSQLAQPINLKPVVTNTENKKPNVFDQIKNRVILKKTEEPIELKPKPKNEGWFAKSISGVRQKLGYNNDNKEDDEDPEDNSFSSVGGKYKKHSIYNTNKRNKKTYKKRDKFGRFIKDDQKKSRRSKK